MYDVEIGSKICNDFLLTPAYSFCKEIQNELISDI